jgi:hypothetical protein
MTNPKVTKLPGIPKPPSDVSPALRAYLEALAEAIEIRLGRRGDPVDRAVTLRELIESGLAKELRANPFDPNNPAGNIGFIDPTEAIRTETPLRPTSLSVSGAYSQILIFWDFPLYLNHSQTEIWSYPTNSLGDATLTGVSTGGTYIDPVGSGVQRFYWIRHVNTAGTFGPWNSTSGTQAATATDVAHQLAVLGGAIAASELATSLSTPIAKIPGLETFTGYTSSYSGGSLLTRMGAVEGTAGGAVTYAHLNQNHYTKTTANQATAGAITTLASGFANPDGSSGTVTLQQAMTTQLTENGNLKAQYSVKIDNNGHIAGFGLSSTDVDGTPTSAFIIRADKFAVIDPANTTIGLTNSPPPAAVPFFIQNGVTYIKAAAILDASITNAKVGTLNADRIGAGFIQAARIQAGTLTADKLSIAGSQITSQQINGVYYLMIGAAAITTANIGNAQIETLQLAGNSVTVQDAAVQSSGITLGVGNSSGWTTIVTDTFDPKLGGFVATFTGQLTITDDSRADFRMKVNGTVQREWNTGMRADSGVSVEGEMSSVMGFAMSSTTSQTGINVTIEGKYYSGAASVMQNGCLTIDGSKR